MGDSSTETREESDAADGWGLDRSVDRRHVLAGFCAAAVSVGGAASGSARRATATRARATGALADRDATDWPQFGGGPGNAGASAASAGVVDGAGIDWTYETGMLEIDEVNGTDEGLVAGQMWGFYGIDPNDGSVRWHRESFFGAETSAADDDTVYLAEGSDVLAVDPVDGTERWAVDYDSGIITGLVVEDGVLYLSQQADEYDDAPAIVRALDAADGTELWATETDVESYFGELGASGRLALHDGRLYFGGGGVTETVYAFDAADGAEAWTVELEGRVLTPVVVDDALVVRAEDDVYGLDPADGTERWSIEAERSFLERPAAGEEFVYLLDGDADEVVAVAPGDGSVQWRYSERYWYPGGLSYGAGTVYVVAGEEVFAIDAIEGDRRWTDEFGSELLTEPTVIDGTVYVGSESESERLFDGDSLDALTALDPADGSVVWRAEAGDAIVGAPLVADGTVLAAAEDERLHAVDRETGTREWATHVGPIDGMPAIHDERAVVPSEELHALSIADGTEQWTVENDLGYASFGPPTIADGTVYAAAGGIVYAINADDGDARWTAELEGSSEGAPAVGDDRVVLWDDDDLVALGLEGGDEQWRTTIGDGPRLAPRLVDGAVIVRSAIDEIAAIDVADGEQRWQAPVDGSPHGIAGDGDGIVVSVRSAVHCLDPEDGSERWQVDPERGVDGSAEVSIAGGAAYVSTGDAVTAFDRDDGEELWIVETTGGAQPASVAGETVFVGTYTGRLHAITGDAGTPSAAANGGSSDGGGPEGDTSESGSADDNSSDGDGLPGPGLPGAVVTLLGVAYALGRRSDSGPRTES